MQTRCMLYLEEGDTLHLLSAIPRRWMKNNKHIELKNVSSYFGKFTLHVESNVNDNYISTQIECAGNRAPKALKLRLPHPGGCKAISTNRGIYDADSETVLISDFKRTANITLHF